MDVELLVCKKDVELLICKMDLELLAYEELLSSELLVLFWADELNGDQVNVLGLGILGALEMEECSSLLLVGIHALWANLRLLGFDKTWLEVHKFLEYLEELLLDIYLEEGHNYSFVLQPFDDLHEELLVIHKVS